MEKKEEQKKFSASELLLGSLFFLFLDAVAAIIDFTGFGLAIAPVIQGTATTASAYWFKSKGSKKATGIGRMLTKYLANFLPLLPTLTVIFLIESYLHNHPEKIKIAGNLAQKTA
mgnify:FL=1